MVSYRLALRALAVLQLAGTHHLRAFDLALVAVYLVGITLFGLRFRKRAGAGAADKSLRRYFLADKTMPWWAIALSIVSAETRTLTIISIAGAGVCGGLWISADCAGVHVRAGGGGAAVSAEVLSRARC